MGAGVPVSQDAADIETDIVETPRQVQLDSLRRLAESGRVSATRTDTGDYQIDPTELYRVFPLGTGQGRPPNKTQRPYWLKRLCCRRKSTICDKWASCSATNSSTWTVRLTGYCLPRAPRRTSEAGRMA